MRRCNSWRSASVAVFIICCVSLLCAQTPAAKPPLKNKGRIKIGLSFENMRIERWQTDSNAFQERAKALGAEVIVKDAQGSFQLRGRQVKELLHSGIQVLVFVGGRIREFEPATKAKNVAVMSYESGFMDTENLSVSTDPEKVGQLLVTTLTDRAPTGYYVILRGRADESVSFHRGQLQALEPFLKDGRIRLIADLTAPNSSATQAYVDMGRVLDANHDEVTAVVATNDSLASGAIQALEEHGLAGKVLVSGQDADLTAVIRVLMGTQTATLYKPIVPQAQAAAEAAVSLAKGEPVKTNGQANAGNGSKPVPALFFYPVVVTKDNVKETVITSGFQKVEEIKEGLPKEKWGLLE